MMEPSVPVPDVFRTPEGVVIRYVAEDGTMVFEGDIPELTDEDMEEIYGDDA